MKTVLQISLVLFVAVTFGAAQNDDLEDAIDNCYEMSYFGEDVCYDYDKVIACVEKIRPRNDEDREELQGVIAEEKAMKNACPGLKSTKLCIDSELQKCRGKLDELISNNTKEVCNEVKNSKDCLVRFNNSCNGDVIGREVEELENIKEMCAQGYYNDGPCNPIHVEECTDKVYEGADDGGDDNDEDLEFLDCKAADVAAAKMCLSKLKAKCTSRFVQEDVDIELQILDEECSSQDGRR